MVVISMVKPGRLADLGEFSRFSISERVFNLTPFGYKMKLWIVF